MGRAGRPYHTYRSCFLHRRVVLTHFSQRYPKLADVRSDVRGDVSRRVPLPLPLALPLALP